MNLTSFIKNIISNIKKFSKKLIINSSNPHLLNTDEEISPKQLSIIPLTKSEYYEDLTEIDNFFLLSITQSLSDAQDVLNAGYKSSSKVKKIIANTILIDFAYNNLNVSNNIINTLNSNPFDKEIFSNKYDLDKSLQLITFLGKNKLLIPETLIALNSSTQEKVLTNELIYKLKNDILPYDPSREAIAKKVYKIFYSDYLSSFLSLDDFFPINKENKQTSDLSHHTLINQLIINDIRIKQQEIYFNEKTKLYKTIEQKDVENTISLDDIEAIEEDINFYNNIKKKSKIKLNLSTYDNSDDNLTEFKNDKNKILSSIRSINNNIIQNNKKENIQEKPNNLFIATLIESLINSNAMTPSDIFLKFWNKNTAIATHVLLKHKEDINPFLKKEHIEYITSYFNKKSEVNKNKDFFNFLSSINKELNSKTKDDIIQKLNSNNYNQALLEYDFVKIGDILNISQDIKNNLANIQNTLMELSKTSFNKEQNHFINSLKNEIINTIDTFLSVKEIDPNIDSKQLLQAISDFDNSLIILKEDIISGQIKELKHSNNVHKTRFK